MTTKLALSRLPFLLLGLIWCATARADLGPGLLSDFESGTTDGWGGMASPTNVADGGPAGAGDNFLRIGNGGNLATFNATVSGLIDPTLTAIEADLMRPSGESDLEMRLVLFGPGTGNRWTSTVANTVPGDGGWDTYSFSLLEADLTRVIGSASYDDLVGDLNRIMFRYNPGEPMAGGTAVGGTLGIDNVTAIAAGVVPGDYDGNGSVGPEDYSAWEMAYGSSVTAGEGADGNGDGLIDAADYTVWRDATAATQATAVPEPGTLGLLLAAAICLRGGNRTRHRLSRFVSGL